MCKAFVCLYPTISVTIAEQKIEENIQKILYLLLLGAADLLVTAPLEAWNKARYAIYALKLQ